MSLCNSIRRNGPPLLLEYLPKLIRRSLMRFSDPSARVVAKDNKLFSYPPKSCTSVGITTDQLFHLFKSGKKYQIKQITQEMDGLRFFLSDKFEV